LQRISNLPFFNTPLILNENAARLEYDLNNRLAKDIRPMGQETTYQYDGVGNLVEKINAKNQKAKYVYENAGRLEAIRYFNLSDHGDPVKIVSLTYDNVGNLTGYDDGVTSAVYGYDESYRKVTEAVDYGDFTLTYAITYDDDGRKETFTGPDGVTYQYQYDTGGRLSGVQIPSVGFVTIGEYNWNRPTTVTLPGGTKKGYEYDPLMRVKRITYRDLGQNVFLNYEYHHDRMDNITEKNTDHGDHLKLFKIRPFGFAMTVGDLKWQIGQIVIAIDAD